MSNYDVCEICRRGAPFCVCPKPRDTIMKKLQENYMNAGLRGQEAMRVIHKNEEVLTDMQALRCIMAAVIYGEIRHEKFLQHDLGRIEPKVIYASVFEHVDGLLEESKK